MIFSKMMELFIYDTGKTGGKVALWKVIVSCYNDVCNNRNIKIEAYRLLIRRYVFYTKRT